MIKYIQLNRIAFTVQVLGNRRFLQVCCLWLQGGYQHCGWNSERGVCGSMEHSPGWLHAQARCSRVEEDSCWVQPPCFSQLPWCNGWETRCHWSSSIQWFFVLQLQQNIFHCAPCSSRCKVPIQGGGYLCLWQEQRWGHNVGLSLWYCPASEHPGDSCRLSSPRHRTSWATCATCVPGRWGISIAPKHHAPLPRPQHWGEESF